MGSEMCIRDRLEERATTNFIPHPPLERPKAEGHAFGFAVTSTDSRDVERPACFLSVGSSLYVPRETRIDSESGALVRAKDAGSASLRGDASVSLAKRGQGSRETVLSEA